MSSEMASWAPIECLWTLRGCGCGDDVLIVKPHHRPVFAVSCLMYSQSASWWIVRISLANNLSTVLCSADGCRAVERCNFYCRYTWRRHNINYQYKQVGEEDLSLNPYIFAALQIQLCMKEYFKIHRRASLSWYLDILGGKMQRVMSNADLDHHSLQTFCWSDATEEEIRKSAAFVFMPCLWS